MIAMGTEWVVVTGVLYIIHTYANPNLKLIRLILASTVHPDDRVPRLRSCTIGNFTVAELPHWVELEDRKGWFHVPHADVHA